ncbi:unnamed protein product [Sympodiomycopsis kandeliae]
MSLFRPLIFDQSFLSPSLFDHLHGGQATENQSGQHDGDKSLTTTSGAGRTPGFWSNYLSPKIDLHEESDKYKLSAELAGVSKDNIKLNVDDKSRRITISGEIKSEYHSDNNKDAIKNDATAAAAENKECKNNKHTRPLISERIYGSFTRSIVLPETVDLNNLKANFKDGILNVTIPKKPAEVAKNRSVTISDGDEE